MPFKNNEQQRPVLYYRNPMNPEITSPVPQKDEMGMDYIPVYEEKPKMKGMIEISPEKQQLIGVKIDRAKKIRLIKKIRTVGKIAYDPDLYNAQNEFIQSLQSNSPDLIAAAKVKLKILGMNETQIAILEKKGEPDAALLLGGKKIWLYASVYEYELPFIRVGQKIKITAPSLSGQEFGGVIQSLNTIFDPETRTTKVRAEILNISGEFLPEMFVNAEIDADLGFKLAVLRDAVLDSGTRQIVFVDKGNGYFERREVKLGRRADPYIEIISGVKEGEKIVISGNFLIDSESRLGR
jgi:Cu(I)/Ag(I) efflux system membrane fusion protein